MPGLYIHIPFCVKKCLYCDFYSIPSSTGTIARRLARPEPAAQPRFLDALEVELGSLPESFRPRTVFIGGGTPTELSDPDFGRLLDMIHAHVDVSGVEEWTCEANPGTLTEAKAELIGASAINRVSLGVQSFNPETLAFLGRIHTGPEAVEGFGRLRAAGITNINLDLIFAVPGSSVASLQQDLDQIVELNPEHTSCYCLMFEPGTPLTALRDKGYVSEVAGDDAREQYDLVRRRYRDAGYRQYEISNFARPGFECRHNLLYWGGGEYIGCGPAAHSHWDGLRYGNVHDLHAYCDALLSGARARDIEERLPPEAKAREALVMGLRRTEGVLRSAFRDQTGFDYADLCRIPIEHLGGLGLLREANGRLQLTEPGLFVSDAVFSELV